MKEFSCLGSDNPSLLVSLWQEHLPPNFLVTAATPRLRADPDEPFPSDVPSIERIAAVAVKKVTDEISVAVAATNCDDSSSRRSAENTVSEAAAAAVRRFLRIPSKHTQVTSPSPLSAEIFEPDDADGEDQDDIPLDILAGRLQLLLSFASMASCTHAAAATASLYSMPDVFKCMEYVLGSLEKRKIIVHCGDDARHAKSSTPVGFSVAVAATSITHCAADNTSAILPASCTTDASTLPDASSDADDSVAYALVHECYGFDLIGEFMKCLYPRIQSETGRKHESRSLQQYPACICAREVPSLPSVPGVTFPLFVSKRRKGESGNVRTTSEDDINGATKGSMEINSGNEGHSTGGEENGIFHFFIADDNCDNKVVWDKLHLPILSLLRVLVLRCRPREVYVHLMDVLATSRIRLSVKVLILPFLCAAVARMNKHRGRFVTQLCSMLLNKLLPHRHDAAIATCRGLAALLPEIPRQVLNIHTDGKPKVRTYSSRIPGSSLTRGTTHVEAQDQSTMTSIEEAALDVKHLPSIFAFVPSVPPPSHCVLLVGCELALPLRFQMCAHSLACLATEASAAQQDDEHLVGLSSIQSSFFRMLEMVVPMLRDPVMIHEEVSYDAVVSTPATVMTDPQVDAAVPLIRTTDSTANIGDGQATRGSTATNSCPLETRPDRILRFGRWGRRKKQLQDAILVGANALIQATFAIASDCVSGIGGRNSRVLAPCSDLDDELGRQDQHQFRQRHRDQLRHAVPCQTYNWYSLCDTEQQLLCSVDMCVWHLGLLLSTCSSSGSDTLHGFLLQMNVHSGLQPGQGDLEVTAAAAACLVYAMLVLRVGGHVLPTPISCGVRSVATLKAATVFIQLAAPEVANEIQQWETQQDRQSQQRGAAAAAAAQSLGLWHEARWMVQRKAEQLLVLGVRLLQQAKVETPRKFKTIHGLLIQPQVLFRFLLLLLATGGSSTSRATVMLFQRKKNIEQERLSALLLPGRQVLVLLNSMSLQCQHKDLQTVQRCELQHALPYVLDRGDVALLYDAFSQAVSVYPWKEQADLLLNLLSREPVLPDAAAAAVLVLLKRRWCEAVVAATVENKAAWQALTNRSEVACQRHRYINNNDSIHMAVGGNGDASIMKTLRAFNLNMEILIKTVTDILANRKESVTDGAERISCILNWLKLVLMSGNQRQRGTSLEENKSNTERLAGDICKTDGRHNRCTSGNTGENVEPTVGCSDVATCAQVVQEYPSNPYYVYGYELLVAHSDVIVGALDRVSGQIDIERQLQHSQKESEQQHPRKSRPLMHLPGLPRDASIHPKDMEILHPGSRCDTSNVAMEQQLRMNLISLLLGEVRDLVKTARRDATPQSQS